MFETADALRAAGAHPELLRWNAPLGDCTGFDAYVLPGGFAYEDRVRAGVIASKHAILDVIAAAAAAGKPVLGVCNGAQVLVEAGLVPGVEAGQVEVGLAQNAMRGWQGYYCGWVHLRSLPSRGFLQELEGTLLPMPVGHGEGRFSGDTARFEALARNGQIPLCYVDAAGKSASTFPENANGGVQAAAAICDVTGNVVALMPHPERAAWLYQVPESLPGWWGKRRRRAGGAELLGPGPGLGLYTAFVHAASAAGAQR